MILSVLIVLLPSMESTQWEQSLDFLIYEASSRLLRVFYITSAMVNPSLTDTLRLVFFLTNLTARKLATLHQVRANLSDRKDFR